MSWSFTLDGDNSLMDDLGMEDTPENRVKVLNLILFVAAIFAPITLMYLLAGKLVK